MSIFRNDYDCWHDDADASWLAEGFYDAEEAAAHYAKRLYEDGDVEGADSLEGLEIYVKNLKDDKVSKFTISVDWSPSFYANEEYDYEHTEEVAPADGGGA